MLTNKVLLQKLQKLVNIDKSIYIHIEIYMNLRLIPYSTFRNCAVELSGRILRDELGYYKLV